MTCPDHYRCPICEGHKTPNRAKDAQILTRSRQLGAANLRIAKFEAETSRYKAALENILSLNGGHHSETNYLLNEAQDIARNALKEEM